MSIEFLRSIGQPWALVRGTAHCAVIASESAAWLLHHDDEQGRVVPMPLTNPRRVRRALGERVPRHVVARSKDFEPVREGDGPATPPSAFAATHAEASRAAWRSADGLGVRLGDLECHPAAGVPSTFRPSSIEPGHWHLDAIGGCGLVLKREATGWLGAVVAEGRAVPIAWTDEDGWAVEALVRHLNLGADPGPSPQDAPSALRAACELGDVRSAALALRAIAPERLYGFPETVALSECGSSP